VLGAVKVEPPRGRGGGFANLDCASAPRRGAEGLRGEGTRKEPMLNIYADALVMLERLAIDIATIEPSRHRSRSPTPPRGRERRPQHRRRQLRARRQSQGALLDESIPPASTWSALFSTGSRD